MSKKEITIRGAACITMLFFTGKILIYQPNITESIRYSCASFTIFMALSSIFMPTEFLKCILSYILKKEKGNDQKSTNTSTNNGNGSPINVTIYNGNFNGGISNSYDAAKATNKNEKTKNIPIETANNLPKEVYTKSADELEKEIKSQTTE